MNKFLPEINFKALIFGAAIAAAFIILGYQYWDWFYPFSAAGLLYAGYGQDSVKKGTLMGVLASTPIVVLTLQGYTGTFSGDFFASPTGILTVTLIILIVGDLMENNNKNEEQKSSKKMEAFARLMELREEIAATNPPPIDEIRKEAIEKKYGYMID